MVTLVNVARDAEAPHRTPEAHGVDAVVRGLGLISDDDLELFRVTDRIFDGLCPWAGRVVR